MMIPSIDKDAEQLELSYVAGRNSKHYDKFGEKLAVSYKHDTCNYIIQQFHS